ncbi:MAG: hypothetical protein MK077_10610 [Phycisphaerales bacterium]|nr:hypothetical protein [Phycisphaerales bacterium]
MADLGYRVGNERAAEVFFDEWTTGDYSKIIRFCSSADAFQDIPFNLPGMFRVLHQRFPDARFVLTIRNSAEQWYQSICRFHTGKWSSAGQDPPTIQDLENANYIYPGWPAQYIQKVFGTPATDPYNKDLMISTYTDHIEEVMNYFAAYPGSLLILDISSLGAMRQLCNFLDQPYKGDEFPWKNKTK